VAQDLNRFPELLEAELPKLSHPVLTKT